MDSNLESDIGDTKTAFRKPSIDTANRKYRRRSPVSGSSPSNGSPVHEHSCSPKISREDPVKVSEYQTRRREDEREFERDSNRSCYGKSSDSYRNSHRQSSKTSHGYYRHDDYIKHGDEEERNYQKLSSRLGREPMGSAHSDHTRSKDSWRHSDKYPRDKYDGSVYRNKDQDRESSFPEKVGYGRRHGHFEEMDKERGRHALDRDAPDEKKDYRRSSGDYRSERIFSYEESKGQRSDSNSRRDEGKRRVKEGYKSELKEMDDENLSKEQRKKYDDNETKMRNRNTREPSERSADDILRSENRESTAKRPKLFSSEKSIDGRKDVSKFTTTTDGKESSNSKPSQEGIGITQANDAEAVNDINAAKFAAMKAAELVNRNLVGVGPAGSMTADQKKKLLWGNKKNTTAEEAGHRWDTALFSDRERQEKFNKLMSLRLPWCLWPIVGCEGRSKGGKQTRKRRSEAEGTPNGFREAVHCWTAKKRWPYCWIRSLSILTFFLTMKTSGYCVLHASYDSIPVHVRVNVLFLLGVVDLGREMVSHGDLTMCKVRTFDCNMLGMNSSSIFLLCSHHLNSECMLCVWSALLIYSIKLVMLRSVCARVRE